MANRNLIDRLWKVLRTILTGLGILFLLMLILSFTTLPFWGYYWLGTSQSKIDKNPDYIVLLGGGGMPSESNLIRAYFVFRAATELPQSKIIISIPGDTTDPNSTARLVADELVSKGIDSLRISYEQEGTNTRSQALKLQEFHSENLQHQSLLLVTSPEHMRRAVLVFKKAGFSKVSALPAFEHALEANLFYKDEELGGNKLPVPGIGSHTSVRYQFWNHLKYEILIAREMAAMGYYKLRGWI
jgi:uncharacterized SAM-binding protein YcdF (DUF218 family)